VRDVSVGATFLSVMNAVRCAVRFCDLLCCLLGNRETVDAKVVADTCDDKMGPFSVNNSREDEVCAKIPEFDVCRYWAERGTRNGEVRMVDEQSTSDHRCEHDRPVWEWLVGKMRQDDLGRHAAKHQRHSEAV